MYLQKVVDQMMAEKDAEITRLKNQLAECKSDVRHWITELEFQKRKVSKIRARLCRKS